MIGVIIDPRGREQKSAKKEKQNKKIWLQNIQNQSFESCQNNNEIYAKDTLSVNDWDLVSYTRMNDIGFHEQFAILTLVIPSLAANAFLRLHALFISNKA